VKNWNGWSKPKRCLCVFVQIAKRDRMIRRRRDRQRSESLGVPRLRGAEANGLKAELQTKYHQLPPMTADRSLINFFLAFLAAPVFADTSPVKTEPQRDRTPTPPVLQAPASKQGLNFVVGAHGLDSLSFNGQSLLVSPESGELQPQKSAFRAVLDALLPRSSSRVATPDKPAETVDLSYPWGRVSCAYGKQNDRITMRITVTNMSAKPVDQLSLRLMELNFPSVPTGGTLEAGMFGFGFKEALTSLYQYPSIPSAADPEFVVPIVRLDYRTGALNFCSDDLECTVDVPYSTNSPAKTSYPFVITCRDIKPRSTKEFNVSLRFGPGGARVQDLSCDVLERYARKYPFQINWQDHRPIGAIFLASSGTNVSTNPRRWILKYGEIDTTTEQGKAAFREALLEHADKCIKVLKDVVAQGMITWDPEGQEFLGSVYYGDPRLVPTLAPEMEFKNDGKKSVIDEYFEKFRAAGLKVGVCIRPQQIQMIDGQPVHQAAEDENAAQILRERIAYAKQRWGCTLFYVDSTANVDGALKPDVFKAVADADPDVLLIPENESMRYFAYSAPFNSYMHHNVTSTPAGARMVYPNAFSVLMAPEGDKPEDHDALVIAVRRGDILLFNGWYGGGQADKIKKIYEEANPKQTVGP
jgi:hypothetical protein